VSVQVLIIAKMNFIPILNVNLYFSLTGLLTRTAARTIKVSNLKP